MANYSDAEEWGYSEYSEANRFINLDGIEGKIVEHLVTSKTKYAEIFWKILKNTLTMDSLWCMIPTVSFG